MQHVVTPFLKGSYQMLAKVNIYQSTTAEPGAANESSNSASVLSLDCELPMQSLPSEEAEGPEKPSLPNRRIAVNMDVH